jgi:hypothetical protein
MGKVRLALGTVDGGIGGCVDHDISLALRDPGCTGGGIREIGFGA